MGILFKILSNRIFWVLLSTMLMFELHISLAKITPDETMEISFFGFLDEPFDLMKSSYLQIVFTIFKVVTFLGILALNDIIYEKFLRQLKITNLSKIDTEQFEEINIIPTEIESLVNYRNENKIDDKRNNYQNPHNMNIQKNNYQNPHNMNIQKNNYQNPHNMNTEQNNYSQHEYLDKLDTDTKYSNNYDTLQKYLNQLNEQVGLKTVKSEINSIANFARVNQIRMQKGLVTYGLSYHMVFTGNPGTGKTTVARIVANIFRELGVIASGHIVEVDRSGLIAGYIGQTALKVKEVLDQAKGGVLFIDEAYSLIGDNGQSDYGREAIDTLLKYMEDNRNNIIIIVAGYNEPMKNFINSNPGLKSRFNSFIHFEDYTPKELFEIITSMSEKAHYVYSENATMQLKSFFTNVYQTQRESYGNGRGVRNLFEKIITIHANRMAYLVAPSDEALSTIIAEDVIKAIKEISKNSN